MVWCSRNDVRLRNEEYPNTSARHLKKPQAWRSEVQGWILTKTTQSLLHSWVYSWANESRDRAFWVLYAAEDTLRATQLQTRIEQAISASLTTKSYSPTRSLRRKPNMDLARDVKKMWGLPGLIKIIKCIPWMIIMEFLRIRYYTKSRTHQDRAHPQHDDVLVRLLFFWVQSLWWFLSILIN